MTTNAMKTAKVTSEQLPEIDVSIKECVNAGHWLLFRSSGAHQAAYFLKVGADVFGLDERGRLLEAMEMSSGRLRIDELLYFSDLPQPDSLSNLAA